MARWLPTVTERRAGNSCTGVLSAPPVGGIVTLGPVPAAVANADVCIQRIPGDVGQPEGDRDGRVARNERSDPEPGDHAAHRSAALVGIAVRSAGMNEGHERAGCAQADALARSHGVLVKPASERGGRQARRGHRHQRAGGGRHRCKTTPGGHRERLSHPAEAVVKATGPPAGSTRADHSCGSRAERPGMTRGRRSLQSVRSSWVT